LNWTRLSYVQPQVHLFDRFLYDRETHQFTVSRYLHDLKDRYGGIDSVLLWPTYPNIGLDDRNQFDMWRAVPGGMGAIANITEEFHKAGVKVLWGYNPWDEGLRPENPSSSGKSEPQWKTLTRLLKQTNGDGFNGDTMDTMYPEFQAASKALNFDLVGEMEGGGYLHNTGWPSDSSWSSASYDTTGWGYYFNGSLAMDNMTNTYWKEPGVDRAKWLEKRGRRQTHVCDRWATNTRGDAMQFAHFNGVSWVGGEGEGVVGGRGWEGGRKHFNAVSRAKSPQLSCSPSIAHFNCSISNSFRSGMKVGRTCGEFCVLGEHTLTPPLFHVCRFPRLFQGHLHALHPARRRGAAKDPNSLAMAGREFAHV
jgi:hypothetical protein